MDYKVTVVVLLLLFSCCFLIQGSDCISTKFPLSSKGIRADPISCSNFTSCATCSGEASCFWCESLGQCFSPPLNLPANVTCSSGFCQTSACVCEKPCTEGYFPCSDTMVGILILLFFYGVLLAFGAKFISDGSELLLEILDPGIIGGVLIPLLGAVPDTAIVLFSGAVGTVEEAQENIAVGVGTLAGSTVMLLTIPWCASLWLARTDIRHGHSVDLVRTKYVDLNGQGTSVDPDTRRGAIIMMMTSLSYFIIQGVAFAYIGNPEGDAAKKTEKWFALAGMVFCILALLAYLVYQIKYPKLQVKKINAARQNLRMQMGVNGFLQSLREASAANGMHRSDTLAHQSDTSTLLINTETRSSGAYSSSSSLPGGSRDEQKMHQAMIRHYGLLWKSKAKERASKNKDKKNTIHDSDDEEEPEGEAEQVEESKDWKFKGKIIAEAAFWLILGTAMVTIFSDPMVEVITDLGGKLHVGTFFVSFLIVPFCSNASELISSLIFASKKRKVNSSLTYSALYGAATMNNTLVLGVFYALIFFRGLAWNFSAEVIAILFVTVVVGCVSLNLTYRLWFVFGVILLYPASIGIVAGLNKAGFH